MYNTLFYLFLLFTRYMFVYTAALPTMYIVISNLRPVFKFEKCSDKTCSDDVTLLLHDLGQRDLISRNYNRKSISE